MLVVLAFLTYRQSGMYQNAERLWRTTIARSPNSGMAHNNLGLALAQQGRLDVAAGHFREAVRLRPDFRDAHSNLARAQAELARR